MTIVGARPQFIKAAPVSHVLREHHHEYLVHTGQHFDPEMSDVFFEELNIPKPDINLGIGALSNVEQVSQMMAALKPLLESQQPDWVLVYGDTNSTLAGALAAALLKLPVAHVEAGLRSYNRDMPEETNRVLTDHVSRALFCPTQTAVSNLAREGITENVYHVGDVMLDALVQNRTRAGNRVLDDHRLHSGGYFLATIHRASNTDQPSHLASIFAAFARFSDTPIVVPVHPRLRQSLDRAQVQVSPNVILLPPLGYLDILGLAASAKIILTDSGGLQKEAYMLGVPCVTLREETEWVETVEAGWNRLAGTGVDSIVSAVDQALNRTPTVRPPLFSDGRASQRIVETLASLS